jgi:hypothetical protein
METTIINMTRREKCKLFYERGFRYNPETGEITGISGKVITANSRGYIHLGIRLDGKQIKLYGHQFAWWMIYREIHEDDVLVIDHDDRDPSNNRITNLRITTHQENIINCDWVENCKGYDFYKRSGKWRAYIYVDGKQKHLGYFDTEEEARQAYLAALAFHYPDRYETLKNKNML